MIQTTDIKKILGVNIHNFRLTKNMTQEELAEKTGITTITLSKLENGKTWISLDTFEKIINALNIRPFQLFIETQSDYRKYKEFVVNSFSTSFDESFEKLEHQALKISRKKINKK